MSPLQLARLNFWAPLASAVLSGIATAAMAYGVLGADVIDNAEDIAKLQEQEITIIDIRLAQRTATVEREGLRDSLDRIETTLGQILGRVLNPKFSRAPGG